MPSLLERVWELDNHKDSLLWEVGNQGGVSGDMFCVPPDSEALTPEGWKGLYELQARPDLPIATLNPVTDVLEWQAASLNAFWFEGELIHHKSTAMDHLATPDHDMWVRLSNSQTWKKRKAAEVRNSGWRVRTGGDWVGAYAPVTVPGSDKSESAATRCPAYTFNDALDLAEFVGWYVSEGSTGNGGRVVQLAQYRAANPENFARITALVERMGFRPGTSCGKKVDLAYAPLARWCRETFGPSSKEKMLPAWVKAWPTPMLERMMESMLLGDGTRVDPRRESQQYRILRTTSDRLVDDLQEVAAKIGWSSSAKERVSSPYVHPNGKTYEGSSRAVHFVQYQDRGTPAAPTLVAYSGEVWCPTVPNGLWLHRRGGQVVVTGNCKVAYEEPYMSGVDQNGVAIPGVMQRSYPGRVRILPLNASYCFPEFHPHDKQRLLRFKMKYRFWGCFRPDTEALTRRGWLTHDQITPEDELLTLDPATDEMQWSQHQGVNVYDYDGEMVEWRGRVDASATPNHRWLGEVQRGRNKTLRYERQTIRGEFVNDVRKGSRLVLGGGTPLEFRNTAKWSDELVESVAWYVCDGSDHVNQTGYRSIRISGCKPHKLAAWRRLAAWWTEQGATWNENTTQNGQATFYLGKGVADALQEVAPNKQLTPEFLCSLTYAQALLLRDTLLAGDGHDRNGSARWTQVDQGRKDAYQMLCAMLGIRTNQHDEHKVQEYQSRYAQTQHLNETREHYTGKVWCPTVPTGYFMARRNGVTYWTGNTTPEGTRQVFTYTELITDGYIEEYINDQLVDARPNPLGTIPIAFAPNVMVSGSPWGLSDVTDIISLNREYNEKATDVSDIVNYHAAPVTVMTGAKSSQLERGAKKMWGGLPKDASVFNLELGGGGVAAGISYLEMLKKAMHELTGVPEGALGDVQPISNTSGVALAIQYQPMMQRYNHKKMTYGRLFERVNELAIMTIAIKEPESLQWSPETNEELKSYQQPFLNVDDPISFVTVIHWPPPLPVDKSVILNELMLKMQLGLVSKKDALEELGEVFPDEKLRETFLELVEDAINQGALDMLKSQISALVQAETGQFVPGAPQPFPAPQAGMPSGDVTAAGGPDVSAAGAMGGGAGAPAMALSGDTQELLTRLNTRAYGTTVASRRTPPSDVDNTT